MTPDAALALITAELSRAREKHHAFHSGHEGYAVIREELDELWDAIKRDKQYLRYSGLAAYEAVQVAAMAVRFLVDLCDEASAVNVTDGRQRVEVSHEACQS